MAAIKPLAAAVMAAVVPAIKPTFGASSGPVVCLLPLAATPAEIEAALGLPAPPPAFSVVGQEFTALIQSELVAGETIGAAASTGIGTGGVVALPVGTGKRAIEFNFSLPEVTSSTADGVYAFVYFRDASNTTNLFGYIIVQSVGGAVRLDVLGGAEEYTTLISDNAGTSFRVGVLFDATAGQISFWYGNAQVHSSAVTLSDAVLSIGAEEYEGVDAAFAGQEVTIGVVSDSASITGYFGTGVTDMCGNAITNEAPPFDLSVWLSGSGGDYWRTDDATSMKTVWNGSTDVAIDGDRIGKWIGAEGVKNLFQTSSFSRPVYRPDDGPSISLAANKQFLRSDGATWSMIGFGTIGVRFKFSAADNFCMCAGLLSHSGYTSQATFRSGITVYNGKLAAKIDNTGVPEEFGTALAADTWHAAVLTGDGKLYFGSSVYDVTAGGDGGFSGFPAVCSAYTGSSASRVRTLLITDKVATEEEAFAMLGFLNG